MIELTEEALGNAHFTRVSHLDGSDNKRGRFFVNIDKAAEYPRVQRHTKTWRRAGSVNNVQSWVLDGSPVESIAELIEKHNSEELPELTMMERAVLGLIADEWRAETGRTPAVATKLMDMGLIETRRQPIGQTDDISYEQQWRRTDLGRKLVGTAL